MTGTSAQDMEIILEACVACLLEGVSWEGNLPNDEQTRERITGLMRVAQRILWLARRTPQPNQGQLTRVWSRISGGIQSTGRLD